MCESCGITGTRSGSWCRMTAIDRSYPFMVSLLHACQAVRRYVRDPAGSPVDSCAIACRDGLAGGQRRQAACFPERPVVGPSVPEFDADVVGPAEPRIAVQAVEDFPVPDAVEDARVPGHADS